MESKKSRTLALIFCWLFGILGIHKFYVNKNGMGILYIFTGGLFGIGVLVDFITILCGTYTDSEGKCLKSWKVD